MNHADARAVKALMERQQELAASSMRRRRSSAVPARWFMVSLLIIFVLVSLVNL